MGCGHSKNIYDRQKALEEEKSNRFLKYAVILAGIVVAIIIILRFTVLR